MKQNAKYSVQQLLNFEGSGETKWGVFEVKIDDKGEKQERLLKAFDSEDEAIDIYTDLINNFYPNEDNIFDPTEQ